ncbi:MAG: hypothetical protein MZV70_09290 [Desulfobacterales bacterium]|nr:hypothetical protein [Desulfobacterales bacterium]
MHIIDHPVYMVLFYSDHGKTNLCPLPQVVLINFHNRYTKFRPRFFNDLLLNACLLSFKDWFSGKNISMVEMPTIICPNHLMFAFPFPERKIQGYHLLVSH